MIEEVEEDPRRDVGVGRRELEMPDGVGPHESHADEDRARLQGERDEVQIDLILNVRPGGAARQERLQRRRRAPRRRRHPSSRSDRASGGRAGCARRPAAWCTSAMPWRSSCPAGPMPERCRIVGLPIAPAASTMTSASIRSPDVRTTARARPPISSTRSTVTPGADLEVGAPAGRREIRDRRALPYAVDLVDGQRPRAHGARRVEVLDDLVTGLRAPVEERAHDRAQALAGEAADRHRAAGAVPVAAGGVVLRAPEVGQDRVPRPVVVAQADPAVEVAAVGAHRIAAVDGRGAADDLAARNGHDARGLDAEARLGPPGRDDARRTRSPSRGPSLRSVQARRMSSGICSTDG